MSAAGRTARTAALVVGALMLPWLSPASAASSVPTSMAATLLAQTLSAKLKAAAPPETAPHIAIARSGTLKMVGVVSNVSGFTGPVIATVVFEVFGGVGHQFLEQATVPVHFHGKLGRFVIRLPFKWKGIDPAAQIGFGASVASGKCGGGVLLLANGGDTGGCLRISEAVPDTLLPLPSQDGVTTTISITMVQ